MAGRWGAGALHPPPREQRRTPSTAVTPPSSSPTPPNHHRGSIITHPQRQLPPATTPKAGATAAQGATPRTLDADCPHLAAPNTTQPPPRERHSAPLDADCPTDSHPNTTQPPLRVHHSAPSDSITPPAAPTDRGNRHPGRNPMHPRRRLPRLQFPNAA